MTLSERWKEAGLAWVNACESLTVAAFESAKAGLAKIKEAAEQKKSREVEKEQKGA